MKVRMVQPQKKRLSLLMGLFLGSAILVMSIYFFQRIALLVLENEVTVWDTTIITWVENSQTPFLTTAMEWITRLGSIYWIGFVCFLIVLGLWLKGKSWRTIFVFSFAMIGGVVLNMLLKSMYQRPRPVEVDSIDVLGMNLESAAYSFPSGHAMRSFILYGFLLYWVLKSDWKPWIKTIVSLFLGSLILLIGLSRVFVEAHFPTDILAGYTISLAWLIACILLAEGLVYFQKRSRS